MFRLKQIAILLSIALVFSSIPLPSLAVQAAIDLDSPVEMGDTGEDVLELKARLEQLGFGELNLSNDTFDEETEAAVIDFQDHFGLEVKGWVDEATHQMMVQVLDTPLRRGNRDARVVELKNMLYILGFWDSESGTTFFGVETEAAVIAFQEAFNLPVSGIVDDITWGQISQRANGPLRNPMYRDDAIPLKEQLQSLGFGSFSKTDYFGPQTETAVKAFQSYYDISADGIVGADTRRMLEELRNTPFQVGNRHEDTILLKEKLRVNGYWNSSSGTSLYGTQTESAVKAFQRDQNLMPNGIADVKTWNALSGTLSQPLRNPMYRQDAIEVKEHLETLNFGSFSKTDYFGPQTESAIKAFQRYFGLTEDGIVGPNTLTKLREEARTPLRRGQTDPKTITLKTYLYTLGYWSSRSGTDLYGPQTERAVRTFQRDQRLQVSGVAESKTFARLKSVAEGPLRNPMYRDDAIALKEDLEQLGYGTFLKTNYFGPQTEETLKAFQRDVGITANGVLNNETKEKLRQRLETPFVLGEHSDETVTLKEKLYILGYWDSPTGTTLYGSQTEAAVKAFQRDHQLTVTGLPNPATYEAIQTKAAGPLSNPMYRDDAIELKEQLENLGFGSFVKNNYFGPLTENALKSLQSYYGISQTGVVDSRTTRLLNEIKASPLQLGKSHASVSTLKTNLRRLGFFQTGSINNSYNQATKIEVEAFQFHYGLKVNGIVDPVTSREIDKILSSPYQSGKNAPEVKTFKQMLITLGYGQNLSSSSDVYGPQTEARVKDFQTAVGLPVSGILDEVSIDTLEKLYERRPVYRRTSFNVSMEEQLNIQFGLNPPPQTDRYSRSRAFVRTQDLNFTTGGSITGDGVRLRTEPNTTSDIAHTVSRGTTFEYIKDVTGTSVSGSTVWYEIRYNNSTLYVHSSLASKSSATARTVTKPSGQFTNVHESQSTSSHIFYRLGNNQAVTVVNQGGTWTEIQGRVWRNAKRDEVIAFLDPDRQDEFQHLLLSESVDLPQTDINRVLSGKGVLDGQGRAFIDAANQHNVNEIYLISHALLETGHGGSQLARGVEVGRNSSGTPQLVTSSNRSSLTNIQTVHNMFGIGAVDSDPHRLGAIRAYNEGWTTPRLSIIGGAKFIGERYVHNEYQQNTIYKMRWNPARPGVRQYATDMGWAAKQVSTIKNLYDLLVHPQLIFDIPVYR